MAADGNGMNSALSGKPLRPPINRSASTQSDTPDRFQQLLPDQDLFTAQELAGILGVEANTIRGWAQAWRDSGGLEGLEGFKISIKEWRFRRQDVIAYLNRLNLN